ncbi:hybrid sensor histidine kinase/response regulator [Bradyrhizobium japonicum]|uniref:hybrid sensor histidine kinase/response regulator n=1 Tax=Bradyrhizobium japonicum TaxID=375 RepID=UPI002012F003|nr:PAS domain-containing sensor histidine kinase [Bradyrhizobium japonicum]
MASSGFDAKPCGTLGEVAAHLDVHAGVILVTEDALSQDTAPLQKALAAQPSWSDIPIILLVGRRSGRDGPNQAIRQRLPANATNLVLLERPLSTESLLSAIAVAMKARQRQFVMRDQLLELEAQRTRLITLLDNLPVGVAFLDTAGQSVIANPAFKQFAKSGTSPAFEPEAEHDWHALDQNGTRLTRDRFPSARALRGEHVNGIEFRYTGLESGPVWARISSVPLRKNDGSIAGAISVVVNIDEQKRAQQALAEAAETLELQVAARTAELERAVLDLKRESAERSRAESALRQAQKMEAVGQLTGGIAHDFNNMLTGIIGAIDLMKRRIASNRLEDLGRFMDAAATSANRAASLTSRLLAFSRRQSLDSKPTDINALVRSLADLLHHTVDENIAIAIATSEVPAALVDANQLENAILNLAINARDAMPSGGKLTVETSVVDLDEVYSRTRPGISPGRYVVVAVSDTGIGMTPELIEQAFDPFFTTKPIGQGTGLGLSMVYGFARQSNGQVRIHSIPGQGTSVKIYLPAADQGAIETNSRPVSSPHGAGQRVLLVEDDPSVRLLIGEVLSELGYQTTEAADPIAAIKLLERGEPIDLMISDVGLPGMNGRQLAEVARSHYPAIPILFVTGYAENAAIRTNFLGSNMAMLSKPFQVEDLAAKISEMLS